MTKKIILTAVILHLVCGCSNSGENNSVGNNTAEEINTKTNKSEFSVIIVSLKPSFNKVVRFIINISDSLLISDMPFNSRKHFPPRPVAYGCPEVIENNDLKYHDYSIKLEAKQYQYLLDSIVNRLDTIDFNSHEVQALDGIAGEYVFVKSNGVMHTSFASNAFTYRQIKLIDFCMDNFLNSELNPTDSTLFRDVWQYGFYLYPQPKSAGREIIEL